MKSPVLIPALPVAVGALCAVGVAALAVVTLAPAAPGDGWSAAPAAPSAAHGAASLEREWLSPPVSPDGGPQRRSRPEAQAAPSPRTATKPGRPTNEAARPPEVTYSWPAVREIEASAQHLRQLIEPQTEEAALLGRLVDLVRSRRADEPAGVRPDARAPSAVARTAPEQLPRLQAGYPSATARQGLLLLLHDPDSRARIRALRALSRRGDSEADLIALLDREQDPAVRRAAIAALSERGGEQALAVLASWTRRKELTRPERDAAIRGVQRLARRLGEPAPALPLTRRQELRLSSAAPPRAHAPPRRLRRGRRTP